MDSTNTDVIEEVVDDGIDDESEYLSKKRGEAAAFAKKLAEQVVHDPTGKTSKRATRTYTATYTKETIEGYMASPSQNEAALRNASVFLYQSNSRYRNLINYYPNIPLWVYVMTPRNYNPDKSNKSSLRKQYFKVSNILESMGVIRQMREASLVAVREGVYYGVVWGGDGSSFIMQKLDPANCQITGITDENVFRFAYDMSKVQKVDLATHYPPEFTDMWNEYTRTGNQYQQVPIEIAVCLKADPSVPEYSIPPLSSVMANVYSIRNAEDQFDTSGDLTNYKLLHGKIDVDEEGSPAIDYDTAMDYYNHVAKNVGDRVGVAISPFDFKSYTFDQSGTSAQVNTVARATENFFSAAGTPALLHGATNSTSGVTKLAIKVDESFAFGLMYQGQSVINRFLKTLPGTVKFKIRFLEVSIFNREEMLAKYKEALNYGVGKLEYMACLGIPQHDILGEHYVEDDVIGINDLLTPLKTASTQSADVTSPGRPEESDSEIDDAGEETRDNDSNDNR